MSDDTNKLTISFSTFLSAVLIASITLDELSENIRLFAFFAAFAIPLLIAGLLFGHEYDEIKSSNKKSSSHKRLVRGLWGTLSTIGFITGTIATSFMFYHFHQYAGTFFIIMFWLLLITYFRVIK